MEKLFDNNVFGGTVHQIKLSEIREFYVSYKYTKLDGVGKTNLLKTLKIPPKYFLEQPNDTQEELLVNKRDDLYTLYNDDYRLLILEVNGLYVSFCIDIPKLFSDRVNTVYPAHNWILLEQSFSDGYQRYFIPKDIFDNNKYNLGVFVDFPVMFNKTMNFSFGFLSFPETSIEELKSLDSKVELVIPNSTIKIKKKDLPLTGGDYYLSLSSYLDTFEIDDYDTKFNNLVKSALSSNIEDELESNTFNEVFKPTFLKKIKTFNKKMNYPSMNLSDKFIVFGSYIIEMKTLTMRNKFKTLVLSAFITKNKLPNVYIDVDYLNPVTQ